MDKEFITIREKETTVRIQNTEINALRTKDIVKNGVRVYEDGKIGISGAIGDISNESLIENAVENLDAGISYPYEISGDAKDHRNYGEMTMDSPALLDLSQGIVDRLRSDYKDFDFSEGISAKEAVWNMKNSRGLDLEYRDSYIALGLLLKEKKSANLFDGFLQYRGRTFDLSRFWDFNEGLLEAYRNNVPLPKGETLPVFLVDLSDLENFLSRSLNGELYATGGSIFSGKVGEKLFNDKITVLQDLNPFYTASPFFDMEGVVLKDDCYNLIQNGELKAVYTDKRAAHVYELPHTGAASGSYDGRPALTGASLRFGVDSSNIKSALDGQMAVLVAISSGGDFTADGSFAAPVQVGFLFDGERIIG
ncbi:MAG: hypothetical protein GX352_08075, partial [Clostridiales bacterium]|nr:hypothetical protein [Clostridiales bacterium]